jgi:DNA-binding LacI/PurR family transcriptional regulator
MRLLQFDPDQVAPGRPKNDRMTRRAAAASPPTGHTQLILLVSTSLAVESHSYFGETLSVLTSSLAANQSLNVMRIDGLAEELLDRLRVQQVAGVFAVLGTDPAEREIVCRISEEFPCVWLFGESSAGEQVDHVMTDNLEVGALAADHLLTETNKPFFYVNQRPHGEHFYMRWVGFQLALSRASASAIPVLISKQADEPNGTWPAEVYGPRARFFRSAREAAAFLSDEDWAGGFVGADWMLGDVPPLPGVRLVSCDNVDKHLAARRPRPASISLCGGNVAVVAMDLLRQRIENPHRPTLHLRLRPLLVSSD